MLPSHSAIFAALQGVTEALPISRSGHQVLARIWLDTSVPAHTEALVGAALALVTLARRRFLDALGEGVRAAARPALFQASPSAHDAMVIVIGSAVSLVTSTLTLPRVERWSESPTATGVGFCMTGLALASTALIPRQIGLRRLAAAGSRARLGFPLDQGATPSLVGAVVVGLAHGLAVFPGGSRVGAALTLLLWIGVEAGRAVDLAFLLTAPALLLACAHGAGAHADVQAGTFALGLVFAFIGAAGAGELLRPLVERRRAGVLALWTIPLGLAMLAYARALPLPS